MQICVTHYNLEFVVRRARIVYRWDGKDVATKGGRFDEVNLCILAYARAMSISPVQTRQGPSTPATSLYTAPPKRGDMSAFLSDAVPELFDTDPTCSTSSVALAAFFSRSIVTPRRLQTVTGVFEELPLFYFKTIGTRSSLQHITLACAAAAYGIRHGSATALAIARSAYDTTIAQLSVDVAAFPN